MPGLPPLSDRAYVRALPKTETHLHLEGALPYALLQAWDPVRFPESPPFRDPGYRFPSFPAFDAVLLGHALPWFISADRYHQAARLIFAQHVVDGVQYVETSFHLGVSEMIGVPAREILAAIRAAVPPGLKVRVFAGMLRSDYRGALRATIDDLENWDDLAGVDLHGHEAAATEPWTARVWGRLRRAGKVTKAHAGEFDGPQRVREAIEILGVRRVQHGVRAIEDPEVLALARERGVVFDVCPISNVRLGLYRSLAEHPLRAIRDSGVRCTVSTDDPLVFGNSLGDEYAGLLTEGGWSRAEVSAIVRESWAVADVPVEVRRAAETEIDRVSAVATAA
jgi:adenosine deaminase